MRELHESVYRCAAVIHANIVSNKASVNNQKLRHSSSANSKSVGPTNSGYSLTYNIGRSRKESLKPERNTRSSDAKNRVEAESDCHPRVKQLPTSLTADQFNLCHSRCPREKYLSYAVQRHSMFPPQRIVSKQMWPSSVRKESPADQFNFRQSRYPRVKQLPTSLTADQFNF